MKTVYVLIALLLLNFSASSQQHSVSPTLSKTLIASRDSVLMAFGVPKNLKLLLSSSLQRAEELFGHYEREIDEVEGGIMYEFAQSNGDRIYLFECTEYSCDTSAAKEGKKPIFCSVEWVHDFTNRKAALRFDHDLGEALRPLALGLVGDDDTEEFQFPDVGVSAQYGRVTLSKCPKY